MARLRVIPAGCAGATCRAGLELVTDLGTARIVLEAPRAMVNAIVDVLRIAAGAVLETATEWIAASQADELRQVADELRQSAGFRAICDAMAQPRSRPFMFATIDRFASGLEDCIREHRRARSALLRIGGAVPDALAHAEREGTKAAALQIEIDRCRALCQQETRSMMARKLLVDAAAGDDASIVRLECIARLASEGDPQARAAWSFVLGELQP